MPTLALHDRADPAPAPRRVAARRGSSCSATSCVDVVLATRATAGAGTDVPGRVVPRPGRLGGDHRALARPARGALVADRRRRSGCCRAGRSSTRSGPMASRPRRCGSPVPGPGGSAWSWRPTASASFVADRGAADCSSAPTTSGRPGSRAPTRSTCRSTRCSASHSAWPGVAPWSSRGRPAPRSAWTSPRSGRSSPAAAGGPRAHRGHRARPPVRDGVGGGGAPRKLRRRGPARRTRRRRGQARTEGRHGPRPRRRWAAPLRGRHRAARGERHDRRGRRLRRRVPRRLVRVPRGRSIAAVRAPASRPGRSPSGGAPPVDGPARSYRSASRRSGPDAPGIDRFRPAPPRRVGRRSSMPRSTAPTGRDRASTPGPGA